MPNEEALKKLDLTSGGWDKPTSLETLLQKFENLPNTEALVKTPAGSYVMKGSLVVDWLRTNITALLETAARKVESERIDPIDGGWKLGFNRGMIHAAAIIRSFITKGEE